MSNKEKLDELRLRNHQLNTCKYLIASLVSTSYDAEFALRCLDSSAEALEYYAEPFEIPGYSELLDFRDIRFGQSLNTSLLDEFYNITRQLNNIGRQIDDEMVRISSQINELK